jgi:GntR family transcriptional regulator
MSNHRRQAPVWDKDLAMKGSFVDSASPLYVQVADTMRERITKGSWAVVSSITVRLAIQMLKREGLVSTKQGRGTFVTSRPPVHPKMRIETSLRGLAELYRSARPKLVPLEEGTRSPELQPEDGNAAPKYHYMRRIHMGPRQANSVISIYLDERVFRLKPRRFRNETIIPVLLDLPQVKIARANQTLTIAKAGTDAARSLGISASAPVAEIRRVFLAPDGTVIYVGDLVYRADFIRLEMNLLD